MYVHANQISADGMGVLDQQVSCLANCVYGSFSCGLISYIGSDGMSVLKRLVT